jgi:hypothetical protein
MKSFWILCAIFGVVILLASLSGAHLIINGALLGIVMLFSVGFAYVFTPTWLKRVITWGPVSWIIDIGLSWGLTYGLGFTLTGFTAGLVFGLMLTMILYFEKKRLRNQLDM